MPFSCYTPYFPSEKNQFWIQDGANNIAAEESRMAACADCALSSLFLQRPDSHWDCVPVGLQKQSQQAVLVPQQ